MWTDPFSRTSWHWITKGEFGGYRLGGMPSGGRAGTTFRASIEGRIRERDGGGGGSDRERKKGDSKISVERDCFLLV